MKTALHKTIGLLVPVLCVTCHNARNSQMTIFQIYFLLTANVYLFYYDCMVINIFLNKVHRWDFTSLSTARVILGQVLSIVACGS